MAEIHVGIASTLAAIPKADISNADIAYIWLNSFKRTMVFDSTATNATDIINHPYYQRPDDYGAGPGIWIEDIGAGQPEVWSADQIITGQLTSTNWSASVGSEYDLDLAKFRLGGSNVDAAGAAPGIFMGLDSGAYKIYIGDGSNVYWKFDGSNLTISIDANVGTGIGIIYKDNKRWLYDFNPAHNGTVQPDGFNVFFGVECGNLTMGATATSTDEASCNIGIGYRSLYSCTKAYKNIGLGFEVLYSNTEGYENIGIGSQVLYSNTTGRKNIGLGFEVLYSNTTGYRNTGLGIYALRANTTGYRNEGLGYQALRFNTEGYRNVGIGNFALSNNTIGHGNIGIGYGSGCYQLDGTSDLTTPEDSIYIGHLTKSGSDPAGGEDNIIDEIVIGHDAIGNGAYTVTLGNVNIVEFHCQVALTVDSDKRIKRNIIPNSEGLNFINALNPVTFQRINPFDYPDEIKPAEYKAKKRPPDNNKTYLGLVAQEVEETMSAQGIDLQLVTTSNRGKKAITYESLIMPLITAVQELSYKIETLEGKYK